MANLLSPDVKKELANLRKEDPGKSRAALSNLKSYVEQMDTLAVPLFVAEVSESKDSRPCAISLFEVLARNQGQNIVGHISRIMDAVLKALARNGESVQLQEACAGVIKSIVIHGMLPLQNSAQQEGVLRGLCNPLLEALMAKFQPLTDGVALCLQTLVQSESWKWAAPDTVNQLCRRTAFALKHASTQSFSLMSLASCLANSNSWTVQPYAPSLLKSAVSVLNNGKIDRKLRLMAVELIISLLKHSSLGLSNADVLDVMEILETHSSDISTHVQKAVAEALKIAKDLNVLLSPSDDGSVLDPSPMEKSPSPLVKSHARRSIWADLNSLNVACQQQQWRSQESFSISFPASSDTISQSSINWAADTKHFDVSNFNGDGLVNVSLKDGLLPVNPVAEEEEEEEAMSGVESCDDLFRYADSNASDESGFLDEDDDGFDMASDCVTEDHSHTFGFDVQFPSVEDSPSKTILSIGGYTILPTPRKLIWSLQQDSSPEPTPKKVQASKGYENGDYETCNETEVEFEHKNEGKLEGVEDSSAEATESSGSVQSATVITKGWIVPEEIHQGKESPLSSEETIESGSSNMMITQSLNTFPTSQRPCLNLLTQYGYQVDDEHLRPTCAVARRSELSAKQQNQDVFLLRVVRKKLVFGAVIALFLSYLFHTVLRNGFLEEEYFVPLPT